MVEKSIREDARQQEYQRIAAEFHRSSKTREDYKRMYQDYAVVSTELWADHDRLDYDSDEWFNQNASDICIEMLDNLCEGKRVLAIGAGLNCETAFLKRITAQEIVRTDLVPEEGVLEEDAQALSFPDGSFDVVICREMIEHVPDSDAVFSEIRRVLCPSGHLLITTPNAFSLTIDGTFHIRGYTPSSFLSELIHNGFTPRKIRGNLPYCFHGLKIISMAGIKQALAEYKQIEELTRGYENLYYIGTNLFVLARKI